MDDVDAQIEKGRKKFEEIKRRRALLASRKKAKNVKKRNDTDSAMEIEQLDNNGPNGAGIEPPASPLVQSKSRQTTVNDSNQAVAATAVKSQSQWKSTSIPPPPPPVSIPISTPIGTTTTGVSPSLGVRSSRANGANAGVGYSYNAQTQPNPSVNDPNAVEQLVSGGFYVSRSVPAHNLDYQRFRNPNTGQSSSTIPLQTPARFSNLISAETRSLLESSRNKARSAQGSANTRLASHYIDNHSNENNIDVRGPLFDHNSSADDTLTMSTSSNQSVAHPGSKSSSSLALADASGGTASAANTNTNTNAGSGREGVRFNMGIQSQPPSHNISTRPKPKFQVKDGSSLLLSQRLPSSSSSSSSVERVGAGVGVAVGDPMSVSGSDSDSVNVSMYPSVSVSSGMEMNNASASNLTTDDAGKAKNDRSSDTPTSTSTASATTAANTTRVGQLLRLNRDLKAQLGESQTLKIKVEKEKGLVEEQLRSVERELMSAKHDIEALKERSRVRMDSALGYEKSDLISRLSVAETTISTLKSEKANLEELLTTEQTTIEDMYKSRNQQQQELEAKDVLISSLRSELKDQRIQIESLKSNVIALSSEQDAQSQQLHAQAGRLDSLLYEKNVLEQRLKESERQRSEMQREYGPLKLENTVLMDRKRVDDAHLRRVGELLDECRVDLSREHQLLLQEREQTSMLKDMLRKMTNVNNINSNSSSARILNMRAPHPHNEKYDTDRNYNYNYEAHNQSAHENQREMSVNVNENHEGEGDVLSVAGIQIQQSQEQDREREGALNVKENVNVHGMPNRNTEAGSQSESDSEAQELVAASPKDYGHEKQREEGGDGRVEMPEGTGGGNWAGITSITDRVRQHQKEAVKSVRIRPHLPHPPFQPGPPPVPVPPQSGSQNAGVGLEMSKPKRSLFGSFVSWLAGDDGDSDWGGEKVLDSAGYVSLSLNPVKGRPAAAADVTASNVGRRRNVPAGMRQTHDMVV